MLSHSQHFLGQLLLGLLCFCIGPAQGDYFTNPASFELDQAGAQITTQNLNTTYTLGEKVQLTWVVPNVPYISLVLVHWGKDEGVPVASFITANDRNNGYYTWPSIASIGRHWKSMTLRQPHSSLTLLNLVTNFLKTRTPAMTDAQPEMKIDPARAKALVSQLQAVQERVTAVAAGRNVRLVAVSKLKPANDVLALHQATPPQLHFGENYAQELGQKAELLPRSIQWHFIGGLQSTHAKKLAKIPNLFCVSSVDTLKKAQLLNTSRAELIASSPDAAPLGIHVQVNTSGEESKSGASPGEETVALCRAVENDCPSLRLLGLMTIGAIARSKATTPENENEDFLCLREQRDLVTKELGLDRELELSMGMSEDFEGAVRLGSGEVRVGSTIFGERGPKSEAKVVV
ncbi:Pyridoxal phosphate homeostasis protein [Colletotrichum sp. SAR 10_76]|nr:Pyridoxal phosphate homeostasis protein [Colletotrichum sp. SAR 10_76]